jgi:hypothetical protein
MQRTFIALAVVATALALPTLAFAGGGGAQTWDRQHLPSPAPGYLPPSSEQVSLAWDASHLPSPAPGYLPKTIPADVQIVRVATPRSFDYRDAAIGAAFGALVLAILAGAVLVATRERRDSSVVAG